MLVLGRKGLTNLDNILKMTSLCQKSPSSQSYGFSSSHVWMWESDHKQTERWRIDAFELWCWRRLLRVPWTPRRPNQLILKEISPGCSLEGLMLKLKLQYFGHLMWRTDSFERPWSWERLKVGREGDDRGWGGWMASLTQWTWVWSNSGSWWWTGRPGVLQSMKLQRVGHYEWLNWTEPKWTPDTFLRLQSGSQGDYSYNTSPFKVIVSFKGWKPSVIFQL